MAASTEKLLSREPPPVPRLHTGRVLAVALTLAVLLVGLLTWTMLRRDQARRTPQLPPKPPLYDVTGQASPPRPLKLQDTYLGMNREPPPSVPSSPLPTPHSPLPTPDLSRLALMGPSVPVPPPPAFTQPDPLPPLAPAAPSSGLPPRPAPPAPVPVGKTVERLQTPVPPKQQPKSWMGGTVPVAKPPFKGEGSGEKGEGSGEKGVGNEGKGGLIKPVAWERPLDPTRVLYRSQTIHGVTLHAINSDIPGQVRVQVSRPVLDKLGQQRVLVPQHTVVLGKQAGTPQFGQSRLDITIDELEFPDGTVVALNQAKLTDKAGAVGGSGQVNNHYVKLGVAAVLSALLNIGSRAAVGNNDQFQSTFQQDAAKDIGQSINRDGQSIVQKQLKVPPTITIPAGTAVAIQLNENLSFAKPPTKGQ